MVLRWESSLLCEEGDDDGGDDAVVCHRMVLRRESSLLARGRLMVSKAKSATNSNLLTDEVDGDCMPVVTADILPKLDFSHVGQCVCVCNLCGVCLASVYVFSSVFAQMCRHGCVCCVDYFSEFFFSLSL